MFIFSQLLLIQEDNSQRLSQNSVMTLNGQRSRSFTSKYDGRWTVLLFTICLWGVIFGGSNAHFSKKRQDGHSARCLEGSGLPDQARGNNNRRRPCLNATTQTPITAHSNSTIIAHSSVAPEMTSTTNHLSTIPIPTTILTRAALRAPTTAPYTVPTPKETTEHSSMSVTYMHMATSSATKTTTAPLTTISTSKPVSTASKPTIKVSRRTTPTSSISTTPSTVTSTISTSKPVSTSNKPTIKVSRRTTPTSSKSTTPSTDTSTISARKPVSTSNKPTIKVSRRTTPTSSTSTTPSTDTSTISASKPVSTSNKPTIKVSRRTTPTSSTSVTQSTDTSTISASKPVSTSNKPTIKVSRRTTPSSSTSTTPSTDTSTISASKPVSTSNKPTIKVSRRTTPSSSTSTTPSTDTSTISASKPVSTSNKPTIKVSRRTTPSSSTSTTPSTETSTISTSKPVSTSNKPTIKVSRRTTPTSSTSTTPSTDTSTISTSKPVSTSNKPTIKVSRRTTATSSTSTTPSTDTSTISASKSVSTSNKPTIKVSRRTTPSSSTSTTPSTDTSTISASKPVSTSNKPTIKVTRRTTATSSTSTTPSTDTSTISASKSVSTSNKPTIKVSRRTTPSSSTSTTPSTDTSTISASKPVSTSNKPTIKVSRRTTPSSSTSTTPSTDTSTISASKPVSTSNKPTIKVSRRTTPSSSTSTTPSTDTSTISTSKPVSTSNKPTIKVSRRTTPTSSTSTTPSTDTSTISTSKPVSTSNEPTIKVSRRTTPTSSTSTTPSTDTSTISTSKPVSTSNNPTIKVSRRTTPTSSTSTTPSTDTSTISTSKPVSTSNQPSIKVSRRTTPTSSTSTTPSTDTSTISTSKPVSTSNEPTIKVSRRTTATSSTSTISSTDTVTISTSKPVSTSYNPTIKVSRRTTPTSSTSTTPSTDTFTISTSKPVLTSYSPTIKVSRRTTPTSSTSTTPSTDTSTISTSKPVSTSYNPTIKVSRRTTPTSSTSTTPSIDTSTISTSKPVSTSYPPTIKVSRRTTPTSSTSTTASTDTFTISTSKPVSTSYLPTIKVSRRTTPTSSTSTTPSTVTSTITTSKPFSTSYNPTIKVSRRTTPTSSTSTTPSTDTSTISTSKPVSTSYPPTIKVSRRTTPTSSTSTTPSTDTFTISTSKPVSTSYPPTIKVSRRTTPTSSTSTTPSTDTFTISTSKPVSTSYPPTVKVSQRTTPTSSISTTPSTVTSTITTSKPVSTSYNPTIKVSRRTTPTSSTSTTPSIDTSTISTSKPVSTSNNPTIKVSRSTRETSSTSTTPSIDTSTISTSKPVSTSYPPTIKVSRRTTSTSSTSTTPSTDTFTISTSKPVSTSYPPTIKVSQRTTPTSSTSTTPSTDTSTITTSKTVSTSYNPTIKVSRRTTPTSSTSTTPSTDTSTISTSKPVSTSYNPTIKVSRNTRETSSTSTTAKTATPSNINPTSATILYTNTPSTLLTSSRTTPACPTTLHSEPVIIPKTSNVNSNSNFPTSTPGSAMVTGTLRFNSSTPVPSEALVLKALMELRNSRESKLNDSVKLLNVTYEKISETSYELKLTFAVSYITMSVIPEQRNETLKNLQDVVNNAVNILLNEPGKPLLKPNSTNFQSLSEQINGTLNYSIKEGEAIQPVSFLQKLQSLMASSTTSVPPLTTSVNLVSGSAVVTSILQFNSSSSVPSEELVLNAIRDLLNERQAQLNDSVKLTNVTYEKISETSYKVKFTFAVSNITMPKDPEQRNDTLKNLQDVVNNAVNILLNDPGKPLLKPNSTNFQSLSEQINGTLNYSIKEGEAIQPVSFLQKLQSLMASSTTSVPPLTTSVNLVSGSAVVTSILQFNSSSSVPSEELVLNAIRDLLNERQAQLNDSVKLTNVTYEKISETSYKVKFTFAVSNITMPKDPEQRNDTLKNLQDVVNNAVNILLNDPGKPLLKPNSTNFQSLSEQINGTLNYSIKEGEAIQPVSFLQKLQSLMVSSTTSLPPLSTSVNLVLGSAVVTSILQFNSSSPVPSEELVLNAIRDLLNERQAQLNDSVKLTNVTYEKISETSYKLILTFAVSNITMPKDPEQRNDTLKNLQDVVNNAVNILLNEPGKPLLKPNSTNFQSLSEQINGTLNYSIKELEAIQPVSFLQKLQSLMVSSTTSVPPLSTSVNLVLGSAVVTSILQFNSSSPVPSEELVLNAIRDLLNERQAQLNDSVKLTNVTYEKISETSYKVKLTFAVRNITMPKDPEQRNDTLKNLQDVVNNAVNILLNEPGKPLLKPNSTNFQSLSEQINGTLNYSIKEGEAIQPVSFLQKLQSLMVSSTTSVPPLSTSVNLVLGSAVVTSILQFNSSSLVPSEELVLNAIRDLLNERQAQLNDSVKLTNVTYEKISETSYKVKFTFAVSNITMPKDPEQRNDTLKNLQDVVNNAVNILLNDPGKSLLKPNSTNFQSLSEQINGTLNYSIKELEAIQPVSFLQKLQSLMVSSTTSVPPLSTSVNLVLGSAVVTSILQFNSSSPVPSEELVRNAIRDLLNERQAQLNDSVKLTNVTYEKISETSYKVKLTFAVSNITMPKDPEQRNDTLKNLQDVVNNAVNILLNEPGKPLLRPNSTNFQSLSEQINGTLNYSIKELEAIQPVSFLQKLQSLMVSSTTSVPPLSTSVNLVLGSAVVTSILQFNSSSPVPSEELVLNAIRDLLNERQAQLNDSVKLTNVTYEKISETSYKVKFTFAVSNITMPKDPEQRNDTLKNLQDVVNNAVNILLNDPGKSLLKPNSTNFQSLSEQINGTLNYSIKELEAIQPVSFLQKLQSLMVSSTTSVPPLSTSVNLVLGSAVVTSILQFNSSSPVPSEELVRNAIRDLLNERQAQLNDSVKLTNVTYEKISETSYKVKLTFAVSNITMPKDPEQRNDTLKNLQDVVNNAVNILLNEPGKPLLRPNSTNFQSLSEQINGTLNYSIKELEAIQPVSFLQKLQSLMVSSSTSVPPLSTSVNLVLGSAVVTSILKFNSSSPVPSEELVLNAIRDLLNERQAQLNDSVKLTNITYEKISETSYKVKFTFAVSNITMPKDPEQRNDTLKNLQDVVNDAVNILLNEPGKPLLKPNSTNFQSLSEQINGTLNYSIKEGEAIQPVSFLQKLQSLMVSSTTSVPPLSTSVNLVLGSAVVTSILQFNSSSPVPSEELVLNAIRDLLNERQAQLNDSVKLTYVTYEKISETSYKVKFTFAVSNITMPKDPEQRNDTLKNLQDVVNNAVNILLNEPGKPLLKPNSTNFQSLSEQINGTLNYSIKEGEAIQPVSFLQKLQSIMVSSTTSVPPLSTSVNLVLGSAVVTSILQFNSSSLVPSEALVLNAIRDLLNERQAQLNDSVKLTNVTYEKISETSYKVKFTFAVRNITMPKDPEQRNDTLKNLQDVVNNAVNILLNEPGKPLLKPNSTNFQNLSEQINGTLNFSIKDGEAIQPVSFLQKLQSPMVSSTTSVPPLTTSVNLVSGSAVMTSILQFNSSSPVPSEALVLKAISDLLNERQAQLIDSVKVTNVTYEKISETSYKVILIFAVSNITMPTDPEQRNNPHKNVEDIVNNAVNTILNEPGIATLNPISINFQNSFDRINGSLNYIIQEGGIQPVSYLQKLQSLMVLTTSITPTTKGTSLATVIIKIRLVFTTVGTSPSESIVMQLAQTYLEPRLRIKRSTEILREDVKFVNVTYEGISEKMFALNFEYRIENVINKTILNDPVNKNKTFTSIQQSINDLLNGILLDITSDTFQFHQANYTDDGTVIRANIEYFFSDRDITTPSIFVRELRNAAAAAATTFYPTVINTSGPNNSTSLAWIVAIIVPCAIAILLIPCWILLCCLLCGCCAAVRQRWERRRSYNIRYYIHNL